MGLVKQPQLPNKPKQKVLPGESRVKTVYNISGKEVEVVLINYDIERKNMIEMGLNNPQELLLQPPLSKVSLFGYL